MKIELCRHLRWKSIARELAESDELAASFARNQVPYSCLRTCQAWGPDDDLAAPELCTPRRECFELATLRAPRRPE